MNLYRLTLEKRTFFFRFFLLTLTLLFCTACTACSSSNSESDVSPSFAVTSDSATSSTVVTSDSAIDETAYLPDPMAFFSIVEGTDGSYFRDLTDGGDTKSYYCHLEGDYIYAGLQYMDLLFDGSYDLQLDDSFVNGEEAFLYFSYNGRANVEPFEGKYCSTHVEVRTVNQYPDFYGFFVTFSNGFQVRDTGDEALPDRAERESLALGETETSSDLDSETGSDFGSETASNTPALPSDGPYLPDPGAFLSCGITESGPINSNNGKGHFVSYSFDISARDAAEEYLALLQDSRFELERYSYSGSDPFTFEGREHAVYRFDYVGSSPDVEEITENGKDYPGDVFLWISYQNGEGRVGMSLAYSDGFTLLDTGDRASVTPVDLSGNPVSGTGSSDSIDGSSSPSGTQVKCYKCHGEGTIECSRCDGEGGKWIYDNSTPNYSGHSNTTSRTWDRCSKCGGSGSMTCTACGGSGVR